MQKTFNDKYYEAEGDQEMEVDPDLNVNLLLDKDFESSLDGDFETEIVSKNLKKRAVEQANKNYEA